MTLCRVDGARADLLKVVTHGAAAGDIVGMYTSFPWPALCAEVGKLRVPAPVLLPLLSLAWFPAATMACMSERSRKLLDNALQLPPDERADLAAALLASLEGEPDDHVDAAWAAEIERRVRDALASPEDDLAWDTVRAEIHGERTDK